MEALEGTQVLERYRQSGIPMRMMPDKVVIAGPSWLDFFLDYSDNYENGELKEIQGTVLKCLIEKFKSDICN